MVYLWQQNGVLLKIISKVKGRGSNDDYKFITNNYMNREIQNLIITTNIKITIHII